MAGSRTGSVGSTLEPRRICYSPHISFLKQLIVLMS